MSINLALLIAPKVYQGQGPPYILSITVPSTSEFNPTTMTSARLHFTSPKQAKSVVSADIASATTSATVLQYSLTGLEFTQPGEWLLWAECLIPGGSIRTAVLLLNVQADNSL